MTSSEIKSVHIQAIFSQDSRFKAFDFKRSAKSTFYTRRRTGVCQKFDFTLAVNPSYNREAVAHIYPRIRLEIEEVSNIASKLVKGNSILLANAPEVLVNRPFEHLVPKNERLQWYAYNLLDFAEIAEKITSQFEKWGAPFFDDYWTPCDIVKGFEADDDRPRLQHNWTIFVISSYLVLHRIDDAIALAETSFSTPGLRKKFAVVFENLPKTIDQLHQD